MSDGLGDIAGEVGGKVVERLRNWFLRGSEYVLLTILQRFEFLLR